MRAPFRFSGGASLALALSVLLAACATGLPDVEPADIPRLQEQLSDNPEDLDTKTQLGIAHYKAGDYDQARTTLGQATEAGASTGAAYLYLGLANEALENWEGARNAYSRYLDLGRSDPLKERLRGRLALMIRKQLETEAATTLAREDELSDTEPTPGTVAVFPFPLLAENEQLEPLQVALADMMITDLELSGGVEVLERTRVQTLLDEMALSEAGLAEPGTGARAGRLLRSEYVVQGGLTPLGDNGIRFDAGVMVTQQSDRAGSVTRENQLEALFDMEKEIVFEVLDVLGVPLTPAEREAINENRAENILAFLAYGRGLMAQDQGNYQQAQQFFQQASQLDPTFNRAQQQSQQAQQMGDAAGTTTEEIAQAGADELGGGGIEGTDAAASARESDDLLGQMVNETVPNPGGEITELGSPQSGGDTQATDRDPTQESQNQEGVSQATTARIRITIRRPGGTGGGS